MIGVYLTIKPSSHAMLLAPPAPPQRQQVLGPEVQAGEETVAELKRRLSELARDKAELERKFEGEQEFISGTLLRRIREAEAEKAKLLREKASLENSLEAEQEYISNRLSKQLEALELEKNGMMADKLELRRQVKELGGAVDRLARDKVDLELQFEREEEQLVNRLQRQLQAVTQAYCALEARLEAAGVAPPDAPSPALDATIEYVYGRSPSRLGSGRLAGALSDRDRSRSSSRAESSLPPGTPTAAPPPPSPSPSTARPASRAGQAPPSRQRARAAPRSSAKRAPAPARRLGPCRSDSEKKVGGGLMPPGAAPTRFLIVIEELPQSVYLLSNTSLINPRFWKERQSSVCGAQAVPLFCCCSARSLV